METRDIIDYQGNVIGSLSLPEGTSEDTWTEKLIVYAQAPIQPTMEEIVGKKIVDAQTFGQALLKEFATENVLMGITEAGKTIQVTDYLHKLSHYIMTGSLYAALTEIDVIISDTNKSDLDPFVTNDRMNIYKEKIQRYLGLL
jgi:hypothetical protein